MNINEEYNIWLQHTADNQELHQELVAMQNNKTQIEDAFYCELAFGTAGLRGVMGAGTNYLRRLLLSNCASFWYRTKIKDLHLRDW